MDAAADDLEGDVRLHRSIVVTGARMSASRAAPRDWIACTVDDPNRSLSMCKQVVDPSAPGTKGLAAAHVADGLMRAWQGDMDGAIQAFDSAIAVAPTLSQAYLNRSLAHAHNGDGGRALADANAAVRYDSNSAPAYRNRAALLRAQGKLAKARADDGRAAEIVSSGDKSTRY